jgi:hypothetical protein
MICGPRRYPSFHQRTQAVRIVRRDCVDAASDHSFHLVLRVRRPGRDLQPRFMGRRDETRANRGLSGKDGLSADGLGLADPGFLAFLVIEEADRQGLVRGPDLLESHRVEGNDHDAVRKVFVLKDFHNAVGKRSATSAQGFQLDNHSQRVPGRAFAVAKMRDDVQERRDILFGIFRSEPSAGIKGFEFFERQVPDKPFTVRRPVHRRVMHNDDVVIGGQLRVHFDQVRAPAHRVFERSNRIFGCVAHRAPVADD